MGERVRMRCRGFLPKGGKARIHSSLPSDEKAIFEKDKDATGLRCLIQKLKVSKDLGERRMLN